MPERPDKLVLSGRMVSYLLMQRTEYRRKGHKSIKKTLKTIGLPITLDTFLLWTERFRKNQLASSYYADLAEDLKSFVIYLPKEATSCLDIGCGLGGIDVLLFRHWGPSVRLHLLDRSGKSDRLYYGFDNEAAHYNEPSLTEEFLRLNGIARNGFVLHDFDRTGYPRDLHFDVVLSLLSWGFHYPVETYAASVADTLKQGGTLIIDVRNGTDGESTLKKYFREINRVRTDHKSVRIVARN